MKDYDRIDMDEAQFPKMEVVDTSAAGFIGYASQGPTEGLPTRITSMLEFTRAYGEPLSADFEYRFLYYAVDMFFQTAAVPVMSCGLKENRIQIPFWAHSNRMVTVPGWLPFRLLTM